MIVHDVQQGSQAWLDLRMGRPTASQADRIITPSGARSKSLEGYVNELLAEILFGRPLVGVLTAAMEAGKLNESEAVKAYEFMRETDTQVVGFITTDDGHVGCSPDRLVGDKGLLEVKAPAETTHSKYLSAHVDALLGEMGGAESVAVAYRCQVQMQLYVCEREWTDVMSYFPGLPSVITRVPRDEKFIGRLKEELQHFLTLFDKRLARLKELGHFDGTAPLRAMKPRPDLEDCNVFGLSESETEEYIASLKAAKVL